MTTLPIVKLDRGIHLLHLFSRIDRPRWSQLSVGQSQEARESLEKLCAAHAAPSHPRLCTYAGVGGKADLAFVCYAAELGQLAQMHRDVEACFPAGTLRPEFSYFSVTELTEYMASDEDHVRQLMEHERLAPGGEVYRKRWAEMSQRKAEYEHDRLYPELPDWEVMAFYVNLRLSPAALWEHLHL